MSRIDKNTDFFAYVDNFEKYKHVESIRLYGEHKDISPKVSITIPTYRRPELLKESVESAINQDGYDDYEIIIVDNDATGEFDGQIIEMLKSFASDKVVYYRNQENIGMFGNWNRCIELATGEWMTILNDDDVIFKSYLSKAYGILSISKKLDRLDFDSVFFNQLSDLNIVPNDPLSLKIKKVKFQIYILDNINVGMHSMLLRRNHCLNLGGFNEFYYPSSDYIFNMQYAHKFHNIIRINEALVGYRTSVGESINFKTQIGFIRLYKSMGIFLYHKSPNILSYLFYLLHLRKRYSEVVLRCNVSIPSRFVYGLLQKIIIKCYIK